ncbi:MAG: HD-GYP domain-containing protein, partial [Actinomycetota bacterium]
MRFAILAIPIILSFLFALAASNAIAEPDGWPMRIVRWLCIAIASTVLLIALQRFARRFIPLAGLLSLTLIFPDTAPSRFGTALRRSTPKQLRARLAEVGEHGLGDTPREAAEQLLDLVAQLSRHDRLTRGHSERVRAYSRIIGEEMKLDEAELDRLTWAGMIHDVGKMYVPTEVLNKPGRLTDEEFDLIKSHTTHGKTLVVGLSDWLGESVNAVWEHHERWEGGGYPTGVTGDQTALASRIVSVADAFDVMTSARSYKKPMSATLARTELERCAGAQFDPTVVRAMLSISLGKLWAMMGPLSLIAQVRLFPRRLTQAGTAVAATSAALIALVMTAVADGLPWVASSESVAIAPAVTTPPATSPPATTPATSPPAEEPVVAPEPTTTTSTTTSTTTTTTSTTTVPPPATSTPVTAAPAPTPTTPPTPAPATTQP